MYRVYCCDGVLLNLLYVICIFDICADCFCGCLPGLTIDALFDIKTP